MRKEDKQFLMDIAARAANDSKAIRLRVGGVVADARGNMVCAGYNGTVRGFHTNECEKKVYQGYAPTANSTTIFPYEDANGRYRLVTDEAITVHAEQNLITHAARRGISIDGGVVFLTHSPCTKCTSLLIQCGISEIVYNEKHRSFDETESLYGKYITLTKWENK